MVDSSEFDLWADDYEEDVKRSDQKDEYPFAGYEEVLNFIYNKVKEKKIGKVFDVGFGTGALTKKLYDDGYSITGIDFSPRMIEIARQKMPEARLIEWDISNGLPEELSGEKFDFIISTYAMHHIPDPEKVAFYHILKPYLNKDGMILIGDISFETRSQLEACKNRTDNWDEDEFFFVHEDNVQYLNFQVKRY
ncbi:MAG: class I SAM-dependent methyltransferase, partial [Chloroflexi bacterium]